MKNDHVAELTLGAILLGIILSLLMCAANTYLGLYAGMTVSASIPAAVISMGILRGLLRRGTIHENNIVQTVASAGESLAAGILFTIPALVIVGAWFKFNYWATTLVALLGGLLGILFMIPLRKALIVEQKDLIYPEGVACSEVLKVGETRGAGIFCVLIGVVTGFVFKFFVSAVEIIRHAVEGALRIGKTAFYLGVDMSVALIGVGYIVGFNIALLVFLGGAIGWIIGIPIYGFLNGFPEGNLVDAFSTLWSTQIRYMGVGAMIIGGIWSIIKVRKNMMKGIREAVLGYRAGKQQPLLRTEQDLSSKQVSLILVIVAAFIFLLYGFVTKSATIGVVSGIAMVITAFFFVAVSSYIVGLVGSSNNPVSGMIIVTVMFASMLLLGFQMTGTSGLIAAILVAGVVCCAAATAGDISQDLKTGYLVKATPKKQQIAQMIGVASAAFIIAPILTLLHKAYGIGTGEPGALAAPQASLYASIVSAIFTDKILPWDMVIIGAIIGVVIIIIDEMLRIHESKFRAHVMPVAVGIYLPLGLSLPIAIGGVIQKIVKSYMARKHKGQRELVKAASHRGILFSSGLIAGEAIMGIAVALLIVMGLSLPLKIFDSSIISLLIFAGVIAVLIYFATRCDENK